MQAITFKKEKSKIKVAKWGTPKKIFLKKSVQNWPEENINFWPKDVVPSSSPDLNPLDFSLCVYVQSKACDRQHPNIGDLKSALSEAWSDMPASYVRVIQA
jgi:hypothetical protein